MNVDANGRLKWIDKLKLIGLVVLIGGLLVGCGEGTTVDTQAKAVDSIFQETLDEQEQRLNDLKPDSVKDGTVSEDMYEEVFKYLKSYIDYHSEITKLQKEVNEDFTLLDDNTFKQQYIRALDDYDVFIKSMHPSPSTQADFELNDNFNSILYDTSAYIDEVRSYVDTKDSYHIKKASGYGNSILTSNKALIITLDKYQLFSE